MKTLLRRFVKRHPGNGPKGRSLRPALERLEDRTVPTVTYHGGALLPSVEVQGMYYGSDWWSSPYYGQKNSLDGFLSNVVNSSYMDMVNNFLGYHGAFAGLTGSGWSDIRYAVIAYPGGSIPLSSGTATNASLSWLSSLNDMTEVTSHELAEAVTDPNVNYKTLGWYDD